jgi:hypothetical protein
MNHHERRELERQTQNAIDNQTILNSRNTTPKGPTPIPRVLTQKLEAIQEGSDKSSQREKKYQELVGSLTKVLGKAEAQIAEQASYLKVLGAHDEQRMQELAKMRKAVLMLGDCLIESSNGEGSALKQVQHEVSNLAVYLDKFATAVMKAVQDLKVQPNAALEREVLLKLDRALDESHGKDQWKYA